MPASAARQSANAANAHFSTGPRTPKGKAKSAQNARKHGLTAADLLIGPEDRAEFDETLAEFRDEIEPTGPLQHSLFDQLVSAAWKPNSALAPILHRPSRRRSAPEKPRASGPPPNPYRAILPPRPQRVENPPHRCRLTSTLPANLIENAAPLASFQEIAKRTQHLAHRSDGPLVKRMLEAIDTEAEALGRAYTYKNRVAELEKQLAQAG